MDTQAIDPAEYRRVLGTYPTGVCVVTALSADRAPLGMVIGSFTSVSLDPPLVGFFPARGSRSWPAIAAAGRFCVNVLADDQLDICQAIIAPGPGKFDGVAYRISDLDLPVIAGAIAAIECRLHAVTEAGDHWFALGQVLRLATLREGPPMLFHRTRYGRFAELDG